MIYDETYLVEMINDSLEEEMTFFNNTWFEFDNAVVSVTGYVEQVFRYEYSTDHHLLSGMTLVWRTASFDEILISFNNEEERYLTVEEIYAIEKMIDK